MCSTVEMRVCTVALKKGVGHLPCPLKSAKRTKHTCMHKRWHPHTHTHTEIQPADSFPSTAYQDVDASSTQRTRFFTNVLHVSEDWFLYRRRRSLLLYMVPYMSREEIDRRVRQPCCPAVAFLSCCDCCLFSSHLYIYLTSAGNPLRLNV